MKTKKLTLTPLIVTTFNNSNNQYSHNNRIREFAAEPLRSKRLYIFHCQYRQESQTRKVLKMKNFFKLFGVIALVAVIGFSMAACDVGSDSTTTTTTYAVTVNGGSGSGSYAPGATVSISATASSGQTFTSWTVISGGATLANANSANTTFTMPANAVTVTANFTGGGSPNLSLDGVWKAGNDTVYQVVTISGNIGTFTSYNGTDTLWLDAINKGYVQISSSQYWRNITSTGNLTWSGQELRVQHYTSSPNVAIGTSWGNCTLTMSADGQTLTVAGGNTYKRVNTSLDGVWKAGNDTVYQIVTISGNIGTFTSYNGTDAVWLDAISKGYVQIGSSQYWRNITSTGYLTWSGQELRVQFNTSSPNVAIGTSWGNCTLTMSVDGQTLTVADGNTYKRQ
ncbi:hypothetical protein R84B8_02957 [Treponema sp. R8-4-B8]